MKKKDLNNIQNAKDFLSQAYCELQLGLVLYDPYTGEVFCSE